MLLSENTKTKKGEALGWKTFILQMTPHTQNSRGYNLCPAANGCEHTCLVYSGMGGFKNVYEGRRRKTEEFVSDKIAFTRKLITEIQKLSKKHTQLAIRLNGFTDILWEKIKVDGINIFQHFEHNKNIQFFDYTKIESRMNLEIPNYHLTFSGSTNNWLLCNELLIKGKNVAIVFEKQLPSVFHSWVVIDVTGHDLRFLDGPYVVSGLTYKKARGKDNKRLVQESKLVYTS